MTTTANCPKTGRSASVCDSPDHRNCPDLNPVATAEMRIQTHTELRALANAMNRRLMVNPYDAAASYTLDRIEAEVTRRQRLCRSEHPDPASYAVCALLEGHTGDHLSLSHGRRW